MEPSNRTLIVAGIGTLFLLFVAAGITLIPLTSSQPTERKLNLTPEVTREGAREVETEGAISVRVNAETEAETATLICDGHPMVAPIENRRGVFETPPMGDCTVELDGTAKSYGPVFRGDNLRCSRSGEATECLGGLAWDQSGTVTIHADMDAVLIIDDTTLGPLPAEGLKLNVGRHNVKLNLSDGRDFTWRLVVHPSETIDVHFPAPEA